ncbi:MAG TPA: DUF4190 domain-containing protein [Solirubrobacteraceae bacterium]|nr:DUF4190 domain-containing protein [Solirubrobacteraceae bacterium]
MSAHPAGPRNASNAVTSLVLGILGIVLCPLLGPVAWSLGRKGEQEIDNSGGAVGGRAMATAGKILGIIGTVLILIVAVGLVLLLAISEPT